MSRRSEQRQKHAAEQADNDLRWLMQQPQFRRYLQGMVDYARIETTTAFTGNSQTFYNLGLQDFVRERLMDARRVALADLRRMEDETIAERTRATADREADRRDDDPEP